jgi:hypothetical protein
MDHHPGADRRERGRRRSSLTLKEQPLRLVDDHQQLVRSDVLDEPWVLPGNGYGGIQSVMKPYSDPAGDTPPHLLGAGIVAQDKVGAEAFHLLVKAIRVGDPHLGTWALALKAEGEGLPVRERRCSDQYTNELLTSSTIGWWATRQMVSLFQINLSNLFKNGCKYVYQIPRKVHDSSQVVGHNVSALSGGGRGAHTTPFPSPTI